MNFYQCKIDWGLIKNIGILIAPIFLYFLPIDWLNGQHTVCIFKNIFGYNCPGCGLTRATVSVVQFHFKDAYCYNKLIVIVFPLLAYIWFKTLIITLKRFSYF